jgi:hypothetical protein
MLSTTILLVIMLYILECWRVKNQPKRYVLPEKQYRIIQPNFDVKW